MTEHNLTEGDVLYHRIYDRKLTIESVDTETVVFDDDGYQYDRSILELAIEVGDYDHRPVRADGDDELECVRCGAHEEPEHGITIQLVGEQNDPVCSECLEGSGNKSVYRGP